ncbi:virulence protein RhuM/Fic/DOC family protein [uncultured Desulfobacter sp.]|uniref:virulence protein RhuM/Fic/DOC family protein n=1 Tax=uncultured Desulfobacter sp. TaxID=240139 RepID=UPI0029C72E52|nr:virulence protein RhuM/Fic/DOC family protein [uncultured Desulfobacter sp.]
MNESGQIEIYQAEDGQTEIQVRLENDTIWLSQAQMVELFGVDKSGISRHLRNIFKTGELVRDSVVAKFATTAADKKTYQVEYFNLDAIISVGYRVNSIKGTKFRIWATQRLKEYLVQGYSVNQKRFQQNAAELQQALALIRQAAHAPSLASDMGRGLVDIMGRYTQTFLWLQQYDEGLLKDPKGHTGGDLPSPMDAMGALGELKTQLIARGEATNFFAKSSRVDSLAGIFGNLDQTVFGEPAYPTVESKAAHLLYFVVKNHPFIDGNKRSGAFLFVDFLHRNGRLLDIAGQPVINDTGLAALTLLVAESAPNQKDTIIKLIMNLLCDSESKET